MQSSGVAASKPDKRNLKERQDAGDNQFMAARFALEISRSPVLVFAPKSSGGEDGTFRPVCFQVGMREPCA